MKFLISKQQFCNQILQRWYRCSAQKVSKQKQFEQEKNSVNLRIPQMQVQNLNKITKSGMRALPKSTIVHIISFLDIETLASLNQAAPQNLEQHIFFQLVRAYYFIQNSLNRTERALYYTFYEEPQFRKLEINLIASITEDHFKTLEECSNKYNSVTKQMLLLIPQGQEIIQQMQNSLYDPLLPMPKLRRENVGMYCNSAFQYFLTDLKYGMKLQQDLSPCLEQLKIKFQALESKHFKIFVDIANKDRDSLKTIKQLRLTPYLINSENLQCFLINDHELHNLIVLLFATADLLINASEVYLSSIKDPYHRFVEFNLRYSIFKNFVLDIQDKFNFAFEMYGELYQEIFLELSQKPKYSFWRPAMTKWAQKMQKYHFQNQKVFDHLITKMRCVQLRKFVVKKTVEEPQTYIPILNKIEQRQFEMTAGEQLYLNGEGTGVQQYFQNNPELYQILTTEYIEYIIDLSVNQHTVHWCGHSEHALEEPYKQFELQFIEYNLRYFDYLEGIVGQGVQKYKPFRQLLTNEVSFLLANHLKPILLCKFISNANQAINKVKRNNQMDQENKQYQQQVFITYDFNQTDAKLKYFNDKAQILSQLAENDRKFYSIIPLCPAEKILASSIDTRHTDNLNDSIQDLGDYFSDEDNESIKLGEELDMEQMEEQMVVYEGEQDNGRSAK